MSLHNQYTNSCTTQYINLCANQYTNEYNIFINECGRDYTFIINEHLYSTNNIFIENSINNDNNLKIKDKLLEIEAIKLFKHLQTS